MEVKKIWLTPTEIWVQTADGQKACERFADYTALRNATPAEREQYTLTVTAATSIKAIDNGQPATDSTEDYYDLSGRRVSKPTKGVFIQNGKKVVIK